MREWQAKFEGLSSMVVPRSSRLIHEDQESCLCTVTLFKKAVDEYKLHCRENRSEMGETVKELHIVRVEL